MANGLADRRKIPSTRVDKQHRKSCQGKTVTLLVAPDLGMCDGCKSVGRITCLPDGTSEFTLNMKAMGEPRATA